MARPLPDESDTFNLDWISMLWPIVLPVKITFWIIAGCVLLATIVAPLMKRKPFSVLYVGILVGLVAFVPSCAVVKHFIDADRFGLFQYATASEIHDDRIENWLPPNARNITIDRQHTGFRARYEISPADLAMFLNEHWQQYGQYSTHERETTDTTKVIKAKYQEFEYGELNWPLLEDPVEYDGPTASNGAGFFIWYSPTQQIAYQRAGYW